MSYTNKETKRTKKIMNKLTKDEPKANAHIKDTLVADKGEKCAYTRLPLILKPSYLYKMYPRTFAPCIFYTFNVSFGNEAASGYNELIKAREMINSVHETSSEAQ